MFLKSKLKSIIFLFPIITSLFVLSSQSASADSLCGPAGSFDSNQSKTYESYATNFSGKLCVNAEPSPLPEFPDKGGRVEWTCYDTSGQNPQKCYIKRNSNIQQHFCTGDVPENTIVCPGDDQDLAYDTRKYFAHDCSNDERKCDYVCKEGYNRQNGKCVTDDELSAGEIDLTCDENRIIRVKGWVQDPATPGLSYDFVVKFFDERQSGVGECFTPGRFDSSDGSYYASSGMFTNRCEFQALHSGKSTITAYVAKKFGGMEKAKLVAKDVFCGDPNNHSVIKVDPNPILLGTSGTGTCYIDHQKGDIRTSISFSWDVTNNPENISEVYIRIGSPEGKIIASGGAKGKHTTEQLEFSENDGVRLYLTDTTGKVLAFDTAKVNSKYCVLPRNEDIGSCFYNPNGFARVSNLENSSLCPFDDRDVPRRTTMGTVLVPRCTKEKKCEYICNEGYKFEYGNVWRCVPSDTPSASIIDPNPNDLCGPAGSSDPNNPVEYLTTDIRFKGDTCATGEPIPYNVVFPYEKGTKAEWICKDESGAKSEKCYAYRTDNHSFNCSGTVPEGAVRCYQDSDGLTASQEWNSVGSSSTNCTAEKKCEYYFPEFIPGSECGTANKKMYEATDVSFGDDTLCAKGNLIPKETKFPYEGKTIKWQCSEKTNPGFWDSIFSRGIASCSAGRKSSYISSGCGDASGMYPATATAFRSNNFCQAIYGFQPLSKKPTFPTENGTSVEWECKYGFFDRLFRGKKNVICSAAKGTKTYECSGDVPDGAIQCEGDRIDVTSPLYWINTNASFTNGCTAKRKCEFYFPREQAKDVCIATSANTNFESAVLCPGDNTNLKMPIPNGGFYVGAANKRLVDKCSDQLNCDYTCKAGYVPGYVKNENDYTYTHTCVPDINSTTPSSVPAYIGNGTGLLGEYFDNSDFTELKFRRSDGRINFWWPGYTGRPNISMESDTFSVRWTGQIQPKYTGEWTFYVSVDDGVRLWVDGKLLVDKWIDQEVDNHVSSEYSGKINLIAGQKYNIKIEYYEKKDDALFVLKWYHAHQNKEVIPYTQLYH